MLNENIRNLRKQKGLSQEELANRIEYMQLDKQYLNGKWFICS